MSDSLRAHELQHARLPCPSPTPLELAPTHVHWVSDAIQPSHPLSSPLLPPSIFPSIRVFANESVLHIRWPKHWSFRFSISPSNKYSRLISFRIDWFDLLADQGTLKSLLQHHSQKASIQCSPSEPSGKPMPALSCMQTLSCSMWDLVPWLGIESRPPALGAQS